MSALNAAHFFPSESDPVAQWAGYRARFRGEYAMVAKIEIYFPCRESNPSQPARKVVTKHI
jgi:hypothetical protein